jgi:hypothetical protein
MEATTTAPAWAHETFEATWRYIRSTLTRELEGATIESPWPYEWLVQGGAHRFHVIVRQSKVVVMGSLGHAIFRGGEALGTIEYTLEWLKEATQKGDYPLTYLCGKIRPLLEREFYAGDVLAYAQANSDDDQEWGSVFEEASQLYDWGELSQGAWERALGRIQAGSGWECGLRYPSEQLWVTEALRWLMAHLPEGEGGELMTVPAGLQVEVQP